MNILNFLQHNAEWICAITITLFTATQCRLAYQQNLQNIRMKRLELANELDKVANKFLAEKEEAIEIANWLTSNASNFIFLLNSKDRKKYKDLLLYLYNYHNYPATINKEKAIKDFLNLVYELDSVLGNAQYGLVNEKKEFSNIKINI
ncbi:TPA: hypothetical protein CPU00_08940 [Candidatus Gastranaerophilales bacterium HUM_18]|nr:MAG TPA: hypothetical protein CPU00_08940 [Candidatus Gastranaerophilales bacterium HUM_18]